jgi:hypothetical protein
MTDIRYAKKGQVWKATWFTGKQDQEYMEREFKIVSVNKGKVYVTMPNGDPSTQNPIEMGIIWTRSFAPDLSGEKIFLSDLSGGKRRKIQTKKRKGKSRKNYTKSHRRH